MVTSRSARSRWLPPIAVLVAALAAAPSALAGDSSPAGRHPRLGPAALALASQPTVVPAARASRAQAATEGSFIKSSTGIAVLVGLVAGVGYVAYSLKHDRVSSPRR